MTGEFRFRRGYSRNPRKMVRLWAEKEMRNLKRLVAAGIRAPDPIEVRENVLPMTFIGNKDGWYGSIHPLLLGIHRNYHTQGLATSQRCISTTCIYNPAIYRTRHSRTANISCVQTRACRSLGIQYSLPRRTSLDY